MKSFWTPKPRLVKWSFTFDGLAKGPKRPLSVIPAKALHQHGTVRKPESRVPGENRDPAFEMDPDFRLDDIWTPVFTGVTTSYEDINFDQSFRVQQVGEPQNEVGKKNQQYQQNTYRN